MFTISRARVRAFISIETSTAMAASSGAVNFSSAIECHDVLEQLITHVPDIVVHRSPKSLIPQTVQSYGVLMFGDISGEPTS